MIIIWQLFIKIRENIKIIKFYLIYKTFRIIRINNKFVLI
jgi:hypothetical protein